jgi:hypothetical protein
MTFVFNFRTIEHRALIYMPFTKITPARLAANIFYIRSGDRFLFTLGATNIHLPGANGAILQAEVNPSTYSSEPFTVHCLPLFRRGDHPLLPLRDGDVVYYEVAEGAVHITEVQRAAATHTRPGGANFFL